MHPTRPAHNWRNLVVPWLAVVFAACGSVGEPLPPLLHIPGRVEDFSVRQEATELVAEWTWPVHGSEGQVFRDMERFEVYSLFVPSGGEIPQADALNDHGQVVTTITPQDPFTGPGTRLSIRAQLSDYGSRRGFAVRGVSRRGRISAWSDLRVLDLVPPPAAPSSLTATAQEQGVLLAWAPVQDAVRYDVQRRVAEGDFASIAVSELVEYLDASPHWGEPHAYRVIALKTAGESPEVPGPPSDLASLTPRDVFPPATPADLRALAVESGVELSWSSNTEPDLAGYRLLRDGSPVHEGLLDAANYSDRPLADGQTATYRVTAVDQDGNESEPAEVQAVRPQ